MLGIHEATAQLTAPGAEFEVSVKTLRGVATRTWRNARPTLRDLVLDSRAHGEKTFLVYVQGDRREHWTYEEHFRAVTHLASQLQHEFGIGKGDRVALAMRNYPEWCITFWAITSIGAVAVPLNAWWNGRELHYGLSDSGATLLVCDDERLERIAPRLDELPELRAGIVCRLASGAALPRGFRKWGEVVPDSVRRAAAAALAEVDLTPEDLATIFYTSGTTGFPKGALGTHRNLCTNVKTADFLRARAELRSGVAPPPDLQPATLLTVPLFHVTGCHSTMAPALWNGHKLLLVYKFDAEETVRLIESEKVTSFGGVPTLVWRVLEASNFRHHDTSSVLRVAYGGAPAAPELVRRIQQEFPGSSPSNGYGLTETSAITSVNAGEDYVARPHSAGVPVPVCETRIVDRDGNDAPPGVVGELWVRGANVFVGYWNKPEATAETLTDGWLHTGDLATIDDDGFLTIADRAKDMLIRGGENIYCAEVEAALFEHEDVVGAAVFGVPHRVLGEEVAASVQLRQGARLEEAQLRQFAAERLARYKVPAHWWIGYDDLPLNANGKVLKTQLRERAVAALGLDQRAGVAP